MKRTYETPMAEKVEFCYQDQVVASNGGSACLNVWSNHGDFGCEGKQEIYQQNFEL